MCALKKYLSLALTTTKTRATKLCMQSIKAKFSLIHDPERLVMRLLEMNTRHSVYNVCITVSLCRYVGVYHLLGLRFT